MVPEASSPLPPKYPETFPRYSRIYQDTSSVQCPRDNTEVNLTACAGSSLGAGCEQQRPIPYLKETPHLEAFSQHLFVKYLLSAWTVLGPGMGSGILQ